MPLEFKLPAEAAAPLRRFFTTSLWLQVSACAIVAWSLLHGVISITAEEERTSNREGSTPAAASAAAPAADRAASGTSARVGVTFGAARAAAAASSPELAVAPSLADAKLALSTIDVIVTRNDTLDRIFRRLRLNLTNLASLRSLPGVRVALDSLRPGELLHFTHRDGELFGLERRLNET